MIFEVGIICILIALQFILGSWTSKSVNKDSKDIKISKDKQNLHIARKLQHILTGIGIFLAIPRFPRYIALIILWFFTMLLYGIATLRKYNEAFNHLYLQQLKNILRSREVPVHVLPGSFYFILGCAVVMTIYPTNIARHAILHLAVGDPAASFFGTVSKNYFINPNSIITRANRAISSHEKSLGGSLGCWVITSCASAMYYESLESATPMDYQGHFSIIPRSCLAGGCAAIAELINTNIDDNLTMPLLVGGLLYMIPGL